jgi:hypothetical protein
MRRSLIWPLILSLGCFDLGKAVEPPDIDPGPDPVVCDAAVMSAANLEFCNKILFNEPILTESASQIDPAQCRQSPVPPPKDFCAVSFSADILPVVTNGQTCGLTFCHGADPGPQDFHVSAADPALTRAELFAAATEFDVSAPDPLDRVEPGDPTRSYVIHKLRGTQLLVGGFGQQMPLAGDPHCPEVVATLCFWIAAGAQDN